jgi:MoxR-like ATPase
LAVKYDFDAMAEAILSQGHYDKDMVQEAILTLSIGNLLIAGPPGTGKTHLAKLLAEQFNVDLLEETANPEWSVYDVIGTKDLRSKSETTPVHGVVTDAIIKCAEQIVQHCDEGDRVHQAKWLLIDEINRCEIDRAFGSLFTALSGTEIGSYKLPYFDGKPYVSIPRRFRIIATMNDYDTRFVDTMSAALRRRFSGRVIVNPPPNGSGEISSLDEFKMVLPKVKAAMENRGFDNPEEQIDYLEKYKDHLRSVFGIFRKFVPIGTAQIIDCCLYLATFMKIKNFNGDEAVFKEFFDRSLSSTIVSGLESDATRIKFSDESIKVLKDANLGIDLTIERLGVFFHAIG